MDKYFCILGGGGIRGAAYTGVLRALSELNIEITGYAGSSIGAVVAGLIVCGYKPAEIEDVFNHIDFSIFKDINFNFTKDFALSKGGNFLEWMRSKMREKGGPVYFKDAPCELVIFSCDLKTSKVVEFSKHKTPNIEIAYAIRASVSMPGLYSPVEFENKYLADGDLLKAVPLWQLSDTIKSKKEKILEFRLENNEEKREISNTIDYLNSVYDAVSGTASDFIINTYKNHEKFDYIKLILKNTGVADFMLSAEKKEELSNIGYTSTLAYFNGFYKEKTAHYQAFYKKILPAFEKTKSLIVANKLEAARFTAANAICEMQGENIECKMAALILDFKKHFDLNYTAKTGLFGIKKAYMTDKNTVLEKLQHIINKIKLKFVV